MSAIKTTVWATVTTRVQVELEVEIPGTFEEHDLTETKIKSILSESAQIPLDDDFWACMSESDIRFFDKAVEKQLQKGDFTIVGD